MPSRTFRLHYIINICIINEHLLFTARKRGVVTEHKYALTDISAALYNKYMHNK